jgi:hypothetical protein
MSVELDNVSANQKEVNTFLPRLRIFTVNPKTSVQCPVSSAQWSSDECPDAGAPPFLASLRGGWGP